MYVSLYQLFSCGHLWWLLFHGNEVIFDTTHSSITGVTVYPKKYAHGFCFAVLCCGYTLTDFPISISLTSLALWQSNDCPSASKATLMNMDKYFMWIHYEWLHNHNKAKHNKTVCIFLGIYCRHGLAGASVQQIFHLLAWTLIMWSYTIAPFIKMELFLLIHIALSLELDMG